LAAFDPTTEGADPDPYSFRGKLTTALFDFFFIPSLAVGQFARQDDPAQYTWSH
jgi:hypothetical protein